MPTYGYECKSCGHTFDAFQKMTDDPLKTCPACGKALRRLINGGSGIIFKGGGFYVTDKGGRSGSGGKSASASAPTSAANGGSASSTGAANAGAGNSGGADKSPKTGGENAPSSSSAKGGGKPESPAHPKAANS